MPSKFSKALLAACLAAALVGCGGGSSTTPMSGGEPTATETATEELEASHSLAERLVNALSPTSGNAQKKAAQDAVDALLSLVRTTVDLSDTDRERFEGYVGTLSMSIDTNTTPEPTTPPAPPTEPDVRNTAWYNELSRDSLDALGKAWPDSNTLTGNKTPVTGLPAGWESMDYSYSNVTTTTAKDEQGKTFKKNVVRNTSEIELTWEEVARETAKTNRSSLINKYLGSADIQIQAIESGGDPADNAKGDNPLLTAADPIGGSGRVFTDITLGVRTLPTGEEALRSQEFATINTVVTDFRKEDFKVMDANSLVGIALAGSATFENWFNHDSTITVTTATDIVPIIWKDTPGILTINQAVSGQEVVDLRFNDGVLEAGITATSTATDYLVINFIPVRFENNSVSLATQNIHTMPLTVRPEGTKTSVMEFAYWASQNKSSPFTVNVSTFVRQHPNMMFDAVTDMPDKLTGMAKYNGLAAGYYAIGKESHGEFTADAMLTADFGTNKVTGMIDSFMSMTGDDDLSSWNLTLSAADFMDDDTFGNAFNGKTSGQSDGGGQQGSWNGQFLGKANPGTDLESAADMTNDYPEAVVGNFTGHFAANNGHVEGAFGTELHDDYKE